MLLGGLNRGPFSKISGALLGALNDVIYGPFQGAPSDSGTRARKPKHRRARQSRGSLAKPKHRVTVRCNRGYYHGAVVCDVVSCEHKNGRPLRDALTH